MKDKGDIFEKPLNMNIHYSQTLVFKKKIFENHLHTLAKLPIHIGPKDMADPVCPFKLYSWSIFKANVNFFENGVSLESLAICLQWLTPHFAKSSRLPSITW